MTAETASDATAAKIREIRRQLGWKTSDLAGRSGLTENIIENIESGRRDGEGRRRRAVTVDELMAIADALGTAPASLLPLPADAAAGEFPELDALCEGALAVIDGGDQHGLEVVMATASMLRAHAATMQQMRREAAGRPATGET